MRVKRLLGRRTAAIVLMMSVIGVGLTGCFADRGAPPVGDPFVNELYNRLNYDRLTVGLPPLTWSPKLANSAGSWAWQMAAANRLYHQNLGALLASSEYHAYYTLGENILVGPGNMSPASIENAWRNSPPHWANIASRSFNVVGIGYVRGPDGRIWAVQQFGGLP
jgi:uncharacterized protein YkwD